MTVLFTPENELGNIVPRHKTRSHEKHFSPSHVALEKVLYSTGYASTLTALRTLLYGTFGWAQNPPGSREGDRAGTDTKRTGRKCFL